MNTTKIFNHQYWKPGEHKLAQSELYSYFHSSISAQSVSFHTFLSVDALTVYDWHGRMVQSKLKKSWATQLLDKPKQMCRRSITDSEFVFWIYKPNSDILKLLHASFLRKCNRRRQISKQISLTELRSIKHWAEIICLPPSAYQTGSTHPGHIFVLEQFWHDLQVKRSRTRLVISLASTKTQISVHLQAR